LACIRCWIRSHCSPWRAFCSGTWTLYSGMMDGAIQKWKIGADGSLACVAHAGELTL
jgi:hypothetical protein